MAASAPTPRPQPRWIVNLHKYAPVLGPLLVLLVGLAITVGSLATQLQTDYTVFYSGSLTSGNLTFALPPLQTEYLRINLTEGGCDFRLYPANDTQWLLFNDTGTLPSSWVDCRSRGTTTTSDVHQLILVAQGPDTGRYNVSILAYSLQTPYGWIALPGTALVLAGLLLIVPRIVMESATRMREEYRGESRNRKGRRP